MQVDIPDALIAKFCNATIGAKPADAMRQYLSTSDSLGYNNRAEMLERWLSRWIKEAILRQV